MNLVSGAREEHENDQLFIISEDLSFVNGGLIEEAVNPNSQEIQTL